MSESTPKRIGRPTKENGRIGFEAEVLLLYRAGKTVGDVGTPGTICYLMKTGRTKVYEIIKKATESSTAEATAITKERKYHKETADEFFSEPSIKEWIEDMKLRRVGDWKGLVFSIKKMCDELQIYPIQLIPFVGQDGKRNFIHARKWLAARSEVSLEKLRSPKLAYRAFAKKFGATDYELTLAGFDAKHYGVGKWKTVQMTDEQVSAVEAYLMDSGRFPAPGREEALFAFKFGLETCRTLEPIWGLTGDQFNSLPSEMSQTELRRIGLIKQLSAALPSGLGPLFAELLNIAPESLMAEVETGKMVLYTCNVFRHKTEKSGAPYKTAYVSKSTFELAKKLSTKNGGRIMNGFEPADVYPFLKGAYAAAGVHAMDPEDPERDYFQEHPIHALRHSGAMRLLGRTNYNRAVVAELGGWEAEKTLEDHYGGVPVDVIRAVVGSIL